MELHVKHFSWKNIIFALCIVFYIVCALLLDSMNTIRSPYIKIGTFNIATLSVKGIMTTLQSLACILMVFVSYKVGIIVALSASGLSFIKAILSIIRMHSFTPLPSVVTTLLSIFTLLIIYSFYKKASINSFTDYITGLQNRRSYVSKMNERIQVNRPFCLACIEIEYFKQINNTFGMQVGDNILQRLSKRLGTLLTKNDMLFSITGPTFAIVFDGVESAAEAEERLRDTIKTQSIPLFLTDDNGQMYEKECAISLIAGLVYVKSPVTIKKNATDVLKAADTAMVAARNMQDKKICVFDESMENAEAKQKKAEFLIKESLEKNWFYLVYQPQFTTDKKELRGFETLIRCKKPDGSIVSPAYFIPAAEKSNLIMKIDDYVLRRAMTEFKPILDSMKKNCILSVNVSAKNIGNDYFAEKIKMLLEETQFPPNKLEIEITEYSFAESMETTIANIRSLRELGVQIALDDFGTGYTSIAQLMKLPVNLLKIDKSLIDDIETNQTMRDMVDSVIYMGHIMNCEVISEGVENESQLAMLKEHNCDFIQGFVWGKPQSFSDAERLALQEGA